MKNTGGDEGLSHGLLQSSPSMLEATRSMFWDESKKLWYTVGPSIFSRVATFTLNVVTQAFAGHLGNVELAAITISTGVIVGFNFGLMLGMATPLETLCGQAFGARRYHMIGIYMQRSWIVLSFVCVVTLPVYIFATPILKFLGQSDKLSELAGITSLWLIPQHFALAFVFPLQKFLLSQGKALFVACVSFVILMNHIFISWLFTSVYKYGIIGTVVALDISWWLNFTVLFTYSTLGCPLAWNGLSMEAFSDLWEFLKISVASGIMFCLDNWYYRIMILMTAYLKNATVAVDAISICMNINLWEMMIPLAFFAGIGVRVSNELGAGNGNGAKYATIMALLHSAIIGLIFFVLIVVFHDKFARLFSTSKVVLKTFDTMAWLLAFTILLNSIQPVMSGVARASGRQSWVAYINLGSYYLVGIPLGVVLGLVFHLGVKGLWGGMIVGGTVLQTIILGILTIRYDWDKEAKKTVAKYSTLS